MDSMPGCGGGNQFKNELTKKEANGKSPGACSGIFFLYSGNEHMQAGGGEGFWRGRGHTSLSGDLDLD